MRNLMISAALAALAVSSPAMAGKSSSQQRQTATTSATATTQLASTATQTTTRRASKARQTTTTASSSTAATTRSSGRRKQPAASGGAAPAAKGPSESNGSTVAIISGRCDSLTDGDASGCSFNGNINTNTNGNASFLLAEGAYNAAYDPDIDLDPLFTADSSQFILGGTEFIDNGNGTFTFNLADNILLDYFAVKGSNEFTLFEYIGGLDNVFTFTSSNLSHVTFFGTNGGGGTGGEGGVPEPGTWAMMLLGFGAAGSAMRRGRKTKRLAQLV